VTNFDVWRRSITPEVIADGRFITLSCNGCPAYGQTCNRYDTDCRANFLRWARAEAKGTVPGDATAEEDAPTEPEDES
jgi:hypothetical protein